MGACVVEFCSGLVDWAVEVGDEVVELVQILELALAAGDYLLLEAADLSLQSGDVVDLITDGFLQEGVGQLLITEILSELSEEL